MLKNLFFVTSLVAIGIGLSQLLGCAEIEDPGLVSTQNASSDACSREPGASELALSCASAFPEGATHPALSDELRHMLTMYAYALQSGDIGAVEGLLSAELRARIAERGPSASFADNLRAFVHREQRKLAREVGELRKHGELFTVTSVRSEKDGSIVAITVAIDGQELAKPFYFVKGDAGYELNIAEPELSIRAVGNYRVKNGDYIARSFSCSGASAMSIAPLAEVKVACEHTCSSWFFDGTRFTANGASADCDYNTWGVDMTIKNSYPVCNDPC